MFARELLQGRSPFSTDLVLSMGGPADLSLHNYTIAANLLALPIQPLAGIVGAFNIVYLINVALAGLGMFLLLRRLPQTAGAGVAAAWVGALLFMCSPFLIARGNGHFSVAAAAALPFFALCLTRTLDSRGWRDAAATGACVAWAAYSDPYHAVYCVLIGIALVASRAIDVRCRPRAGRTPTAIRLLDGLIVLLTLTIVVVHGLGGGAVSIGPLAISMRSLYTPMLALSLLVAARLWSTLRPGVVGTAFAIRPLVVPGLVAVGVSLLLLAPLLAAMATRSADGRMVTAPVLWRSSAPGADLAAVVMPNPNHPLTPSVLVEWVKRQPGESSAALPWVALLTIAVGWRRLGVRPDRTWLAIGVVFLWMSLGPFVRIAGFEPLIPTPWTLARYLPLIGEARMPSRMSVLVVLAVSVLFTAAWAALDRRSRTAAALVAIALAFELLAAPRPLYSAAIPDIFEPVRQGPAHARVLHIPTGIKDGLHADGDFKAAALFYQTAHHRPLVSGYLSRISGDRKALYNAHPVFGLLIAESAGVATTPDERDRARSHAADFVGEQQIGWVVIDEDQAPASLQAFVIDLLQLRLVLRRGSFALYVPEIGTAYAME